MDCAAEETPEHDYVSDDSADYKVNYTDSGALRAESEARRQWNYVCPTCAQRFNRPCRLEMHMRSHNKERPFACTELGCDKTFPRKDHLQRHLKNAHSDPATERTFVCDWNACGKRFTSNGRLQRHRDVHESKFYCTAYPPCNAAFRKAKALEAHVKSLHLQVKPYACAHVHPDSGEKCTSGYQTESALRRHMERAHVDIREQGHFCMLCTTVNADEALLATDSGDTFVPPSFATKEDLEAHTLDCHPPVCIKCGQKFKSASTLRTHLDNVHGDSQNQPQYPCPRLGCDSVFNRKHNLTVHIQTVHDKQARYSCTPDALRNSKHVHLQAWDGDNACGASFKAKSSLDQHVRTHHLGLGNRKEVRKAAKSRKKPEPSMLTMLTGVGYEQGREVPCLVKTCEYRFYMDRDLRRHLRAEHSISEDDIEEMIQERDAVSGGQFWIGGFDESVNMFDSATPSMPETPAPYSVEGTVPTPSYPDTKNMDTPHGFFDQQFHHLSLLNEEADLDMQMGLENLAPAVNPQAGLQWDMLVPVEQYNSDTICR
ncbi:c2h2 transcription factor [Pyrenophora seminiperda CCB06]|uniref:C2h2 transcription factor n=1 Tax=Pyrenophora seminiperda CCB06 TaxID=1302712 RepID=A0A3M7MCU5_9PLEO|nr:c2h2 transcription factor [Pyrenophora seminiperda CCB06]